MGAILTLDLYTTLYKYLYISRYYLISMFGGQNMTVTKTELETIINKYVCQINLTQKEGEIVETIVKKKGCYFGGKAIKDKLKAN